MSFVDCADVLGLLKKAGDNTNRLRQDRLLSESTIQKLRTGQMISMHQIDTICGLLHCTPGVFIRYVPGGNDTRKDGDDH